MTRQEKIQEAKFEVKNMRLQVKMEAEQIRKDALRIQEELAEIAKFAGQIVADPGSAKHFQVNPWDSTSWRNLQSESVKLDTKIKAVREMENLISLIDE